MNTTFSSLRAIRALLLLVMCTAFLAACSGSSPTQSNGHVTITLAGPNQWNSSGTSFGSGWDAAVAQFEKLNPGVTVKINVLPLANFGQIEATDLASGAAPDLIFNQTSYKPYQVVPLDQYLNQPNPYAPGRPKWIDWFNPNAYGFNNPGAVDAQGHLDWVPLNLFDVGLFINEDLFAKVGVTAPIATFQHLLTAIQKFKAAGMAPMAMDNSVSGTAWPLGAILNMLMTKDYTTFNYFTATGTPGSNSSLTVKDFVRAIKTGQLTAESPKVGESHQLDKELYSLGATPNWSGIKGLSGAGVDLNDFLAGRAAMAWGANFGAAQVASAPFKVGSMGFPTITDATTPLSVNQPAQFGVQAGGTSYMIPSTTKGEQLKYAVRFLQFMTAPQYAQPWITATTGVPSVQDVTAAPSIAGFSAGAWGTTPKSNGYALVVSLSPQATQDAVQIVQGYLLGSTDLAATEAKLETSWQAAVAYQLQQNPSWQSESWAH